MVQLMSLICNDDLNFLVSLPMKTFQDFLYELQNASMDIPVKASRRKQTIELNEANVSGHLQTLNRICVSNLAKSSPLLNRELISNDVIDTNLMQSYII